MKRTILIILIIIGFQTVLTYSQELDKNDYSKLIGKVYYDLKDIGDPIFMMDYLLDPATSDYGITLYRFGKTVLVTFEQNTHEEENGKLKWEIIDIVVAPKKTYFDHWCCKLVENDKYDRESIAFIKPRFFLKDKVIKMYKADRQNKMFVEMSEKDCYKEHIKRIKGLKYK